jgi:hypothetical protein
VESGGCCALSACSGTVLGWVCVYSATGCTADSSRAESGAWWWHCAYPCCSTVASPPTLSQQARAQAPIELTGIQTAVDAL